MTIERDVNEARHKTIVVYDGSPGYADLTEALARGDDILLVGPGGGGGGCGSTSVDYPVSGGGGSGNDRCGRVPNGGGGPRNA